MEGNSLSAGERVLWRRFWDDENARLQGMMRVQAGRGSQNLYRKKTKILTSTFIYQEHNQNRSAQPQA